jgi:ArsR family transcriptional regulator
VDVPSSELDTLAARAEDVAGILRSLGNPARLTVLCTLFKHGEMSVGDLAGMVGLSQSALSQHLARMREDGLVAFRRVGQSVFYRGADPRCEALLPVLYRLYCSNKD